MFKPVIYRLRTPMRLAFCDDGGTFRQAELTEATFNFRTGEQEPPSDGLVANCHRSFCDEDGKAVPVEVLSLLDLEGGLRQAFKAATDEFFTEIGVE